MTRSARAGQESPFLPPAISAWLRQRSRQLLGLGLALSGAALALAIGSFETSDPSLNTATAGEAHNLWGGTGAVVADFALQATGVAALLPALALLVWGWRLIARRRFSLWGLRVAALGLAFALGAAATAAVPAPESWPLRSGLGGVIGSHLLDFVHAGLAGWGSPMGPTLPALAAGLAGFLALSYALAISAREWRAAGQMLWRLGAGTARRIGRGASRTRTDQAPGDKPRRQARDGTSVSGRAPRGGKKRREPLVASKLPTVPPGRRAEQERQPSLAFTAVEGYCLPDLDLLKPPPARRVRGVDEASLEQNARYLETVLADFRVNGKIIKVRPGPVVSLYELQPTPGTKASRIVALADDIARSMSVLSARVAAVPGRNVIGIELPNGERETVYLRELLASRAYEKCGHRLPLILGKDIAGEPVIADLSRMPHLLIAGSTGAGKSVAINTMILSLIYRLPPEACRLILIDPKMLELSVYEDIPQLLTPVVTDPGKAVVALKWAVREMEERYRVMSKLGVRSIESYNARLADATKRGVSLASAVAEGADDGAGIDEPAAEPQPLPFIVIIVDEMADLMLVSGKEIEITVQRLSQMARAAGIHLIMATQRPSVDVITGTIKANFPSRISFQVTSKIDSRTILGEQGAEQLLRQGDMLYQAAGGRTTRVHGPFVDDSEVEAVVRHVKSQGQPHYVDAVVEEDEADAPDGPGGAPDERYDEAVALVLREGKASASFIQRHLQIGYNRAARMIDRMEADGIVSPANHAGKREILGPGRNPR